MTNRKKELICSQTQRSFLLGGRREGGVGRGLGIRSDTDWIADVLQKDKTKAQMPSVKSLFKDELKLIN